MSITSILKFVVFGESYQDLVFLIENRISEFFEINIEDVSKKFNYELVVSENQDMNSSSTYEAEVIVRGRDV